MSPSVIVLIYNSVLHLFMNLCSLLNWALREQGLSYLYFLYLLSSMLSDNDWIEVNGLELRAKSNAEVLSVVDLQKSQGQT